MIWRCDVKDVWKTFIMWPSRFWAHHSAWPCHNNFYLWYFLIGTNTENLVAIIDQKSKDELVSDVLHLLDALHNKCNWTNVIESTALIESLSCWLLYVFKKLDPYEFDVPIVLYCIKFLALIMSIRNICLSSIIVVTYYLVPHN